MQSLTSAGILTLADESVEETKKIKYGNAQYVISNVDTLGSWARNLATASAPPEEPEEYGWPELDQPIDDFDNGAYQEEDEEPQNEVKNFVAPTININDVKFIGGAAGYNMMFDALDEFAQEGRGSTTDLSDAFEILEELKPWAQNDYDHLVRSLYSEIHGMLGAKFLDKKDISSKEELFTALNDASTVYDAVFTEMVRQWAIKGLFSAYNQLPQPAEAEADASDLAPADMAASPQAEDVAPQAQVSDVPKPELPTTAVVVRDLG